MHSQLFFKSEIASLPIGNELLRTEKNIFPYASGRPSDELATLDEYYELIRNIIDENNETFEDYDVSIGTRLGNVVSDNIKCVYVSITYPLTNPAIIRFKCNQSITYGILHYLVTAAYQIVYKIEEDDDADPGLIIGTFNRAKSNGRFGIWGHDITDLVYNSCSTINIYDDYIVCNFDCDS